MSQLQLPPLSLYIHIPWCERKCPYCDFNSHATAQTLPELAYVTALLEDLDLELPLVQGRAIQTIFIGGGTPSLFSVDAYQRLLRGIRDRIDVANDVEITLEANPGSAEAEKFAGFAAAGVTRISLGIQSLDNALLLRLGRVHDAEQALAAIEMAARCGISTYNIDLMHGLPQQDTTTARTDLEAVLAIKPPHISWYQLTIEPNTRFYSDQPELPGESILASIQDEGETMLSSAGFNNYEVSAWRQPGQACRHNLNYWQFGDYIGIGAGAHGKLTDMTTQQIRRSSRKKQPDEYMRSTADARNSYRPLDADDLRGEYILNTLRLQEGFAIKDFTARTGLSWNALEATATRLAGQNLLEVTSSQVKASALGRRYLDSVIAEFF